MGARRPAGTGTTTGDRTRTPIATGPESSRRSDAEPPGADTARAGADRRASIGLAAGFAANGVGFAVLAYVALIHALAPDLYHQSVQEDEYLEWATFWAFLFAAGLFAAHAIRRRRLPGPIPWFPAGLALFCFVVAMEEISWAQRVFAYRPPTYFLTHNFQQEPNLHNVVDTSLRQLALQGVIAGYGVLLPLLALGAGLRRRMRGLGIESPPLALVPLFATTWLLYAWYPFSFTGETVELLLGLGFLCVAVIEAGARGRPFPRAAPAIAGLAALSLALGVATAATGRGLRGSDPERATAARVEVGALARDLRAGSQRGPTRCGIHKRLYSYEQKYGIDLLRGGRFASLEGMPEERAVFYLDPWNAPYWIRDECDDDTGAQSVFVYSFGPNGKRDSTDWAIGGDDIGVMLYRRDPR